MGGNCDPGAKALWPVRAARCVRWTRRFAVVVCAAVLAAVPMAAPDPAQAAGNAVMDVSVVAVDAATGAPITSTSPSQYANKVAFRVDFSCLVAACANATVKFDPTQLDPNHNLYRLLHQSGFTPPVSGGSVTGSATAGYTVALGNLAAGSSGSFVLEYQQQPAPGAHGADATPGGEYNNWAVSNFPIGFGIVQKVTANADTAAAPTTASSAPVTWNNTIPNPSLLVGASRYVAPNGLPTTVETDKDYTYALFMGSGCTHGAGYGPGGKAHAVYVDPPLCAQDYTVTHQLPPGVEFVSATGNPVVTGSAATGYLLTWNAPPASAWAEFNNNSAGWEGLDGGGNGGGASPRGVTVRFPRENFAPAGTPCEYTVTSGVWESDVSATYISLPGQPGAVRTASLTTAARTVMCINPFGKATADPKVSTFDGDVRLLDGSSPIRVPGDGQPANDKEWRVTVANQANVAGVAVVTDNTLDLADAPVSRIETTPTGASVAWTATDGTTTQSGTSTAPVDAPAGFRFATAVVTSLPLAGPNRLATGTARTNFMVTFKYRVTEDAPPGETRTNQATAVMTYPDYPALADVPVTIAPHTITFAVPFGRSTVDKWSNGTLTGGEYRITIPESGNGSLLAWLVDVRNAGNVPGVPVVTEDELAGPGGLPIVRIDLQYHRALGGYTGTTGTVAYTLDDGTTGTATVPANGILNAPAGRHFVQAVVSGAPIEGLNTRQERNTASIFRVAFYYQVKPDAPVDAVLTNTASGTMTYPGYDIAPITNTDSATVHLVPATPTPPPPVTFNASVARLPLPGGATQAGTTTDVTFTVGGSTGNVPVDRDLTVQYAFVAPEGWRITPGSASFPAGSVPIGVTFDYRTVTIGGIQREAVVATWPTDIVFGENRSLPLMTVVARPGPTVPAGTVSRPDAYIGNSRNDSPATDVFNTNYVDATDMDGDGNIAERFARANNTNAGTTVASVPAMQVLKEICLPDADEPDGCRWIADPDNVLGVAPNSTSIKYRLTVTNTGNTTLSDVVGYDVLPYIGDTGTSNPTGATPRGSTFQEQIVSATVPTNGATATFSAAQQPCRPEVDSTVPGCVNDWGPTSTNAQSIRLARAGALAPGGSFSMEYTGAVIDAPSDGAVACNSFAVAATGLGTVSEPAPVCAAVAETDLRIVAGTPQLQVGRPGVLPFTVTNLGGADSSQGEVEVAIPTGVTVTGFTFGGWVCTAVDAAGEPVYGTAVGPVTLTCTPHDPLLLDQPVALNIPVVLTADEMVVPAEVTGRLFDPNLANNEDDMSILAAPAAGAIGVAKDDGLTTVAPGSQVTYTVTVTNPLAFETLTGGALTDVLPAGLEFVSATGGGVHNAGTITWDLDDIAPAGSTAVTVTARVLTTITATQIDNVANVSAPDPADENRTLTGTDNDLDTITSHPALTLDKGSVLPQYAAVGDTIDYTFTIANTGDVTLHDVAVNDPLAGLGAIAYTWPGTPPTPGVLAPGQTATATAAYTVTQADVDAGQVLNTAEAAGTPPVGDAVRATDTHTVTGSAVPHLTVTKLATPDTAARVGDRVDYAITLLNDGPIRLQDVTISDPLPGLSALVYDWPATPGVLAPGEELVATGTYSVTQADVDAGEVHNTATGTATTAGSLSASGQDTAVVAIPAQPDIEIVKDADYADGTIGLAGDTLHYTFTVTNTGNVTLTGVTIADPLPGLSSLQYTWPGTPGELAPNQVVTATADYVVTQADVDALEGVTNTATASGTGRRGGDVSDDDTVTMDTPATSGIQIAKTATLIGDTPVLAGDEIEYRFAVTNLGAVTLTDVVLADPMPGLSALELTWPETPGTLAPHEVLTAVARYTITQGDIDTGHVTNTATTSGTTPEEVTVDDEDTATVVLPSTPSIALVKTASTAPGPWSAGGTVDYQFAVTNTGNVTLEALTLSDPMPGLSAIACPASTLAPGATTPCTADYTITQGDIDTGQLANTATATATPPVGAPVSDESTVTITAVQNPAVTLVKTVEETTFEVGSTLHYRFAVTNIGNVTLGALTVSDPLPGLSAIECPASALAPGATTTCTAEYLTTQADVDAGSIVNTATASATPPVGDPVSDESTVTIAAVRNPALALVKTVEEATFTVGSALHFRFAVTNTGNTTITNLTVNDPMPGLSPITCPTGTLPPGQATTCTATYVATQADVNAGSITNTATASASPPGTPPLVSEPSTVQVAVAATPPPPPPTTPAPTAPANPGELPATGGGNLPRTTGLGAVLLLAGLIAGQIARRRRRSA